MLNEALRLIRVYHDFKQKDLADRLGISNSYLSEIETGNKTPTLEIIEKYAEVFKMPSSSILFFSEHLNAGEKSNTVRKQVSQKVLKILNWIAEKKRRLRCLLLKRKLDDTPIINPLLYKLKTKAKLASIFKN